MFVKLLNWGGGSCGRAMMTRDRSLRVSAWKCHDSWNGWALAKAGGEVGYRQMESDALVTSVQGWLWGHS